MRIWYKILWTSRLYSFRNLQFKELLFLYIISGSPHFFVREINNLFNNFQSSTLFRNCHETYTCFLSSLTKFVFLGNWLSFNDFFTRTALCRVPCGDYYVTRIANISVPGPACVRWMWPLTPIRLPALWFQLFDFSSYLTIVFHCTGHVIWYINTNHNMKAKKLMKHQCVIRKVHFVMTSLRTLKNSRTT